MNPGIAVMPVASIVRSPGGAPVPAATDSISPLRTTIVPRSMTVPVLTTMRALVIATSCAIVFDGSSSMPAAAARTMMSKRTGVPPLFVEPLRRLLVLDAELIDQLGVDHDAHLQRD